MTDDGRETCVEPDCFRAAVRNGRCWTHTWRKAHGKPMAAPLPEKLSPFARYIEASVYLADVDSENDQAYSAAVQRVRRAGEAWLRSIGWRPPLQKRARPTYQYPLLPFRN